MTRSEAMPDVLRSDHRAITQLLATPGIATDNDAALTEREQLVMSLVRHFVAEEEYLYPLIRERLPDGAALADIGLEADRACEDELRRLEDETLDSAALAAVLQDVSDAFAEHVRRQEPVLDQLQQICAPTELAELGADVLGAEQVAPTRPRPLPTVPGVAGRVINFVEGYLDQVRDYYAKRGVEPDSST